MEELIKYYKKVEILCKIDIKKLHNVEFDDLYDYYIHKLLVLWNRYQNKHKDSYTFEKLYNADKQFWLYNYLNSSKKRHEISYDVIIDDLGEEEQSYLLEDFDDLDKKIENKLYIQQLIKKANFNKQEMKCIQLFLDGYKVNEINKIFGTKKIWKDVRKKMKEAKELIK